MKGDGVSSGSAITSNGGSRAETHQGAWRRRGPRWVAHALTVVGVLLGSVAAEAAAEAAVGPIGVTVSDVDRSMAFYAEVLGFEPVSDIELAGPEYERLQGVFAMRARVVRMRLGTEEIELTEYLAPRGRPVPPDSRSNDHWFQHIAIVVSDMDAAYRRLQHHKVVHASSGPQRLPDWNPNAGGIRAFYFEDPDGHTLEVLSFPPGKGDPRWQQPRGRLFLGIDHTAIVVRDTDASIAFYRDVLGLVPAGTSDNYGPEQEQLNGVFGARLRITTLRALRGGPGIELLEYVAPPGGRPMPPDVRANDLVHWQVRLRAVEPGRLIPSLRRARAWFVSPGLVSVSAAELGFRQAILVRDPDGHALQIAAE
jgi:catechol 2,3-dioxygenase-like lactoylglutathione lyase family enzyme